MIVVENAKSYIVNLIRAATERRRPSEAEEQKQQKAQDVGKDVEIHLTLKFEPYNMTTENRCLLRFKITPNWV